MDAISAAMKDLRAWSEGKPPLVRAWVETICDNLRRLKKSPDNPALLSQTARNVAELRRLAADH